MIIISRVYRCLDTAYQRRQVRLEWSKNRKEAHSGLVFRGFPDLTNQEKRLVDDYWGQYGIRISDYAWFAWFKGVWGAFDVRFIPQDIYKFVLYPYLNDTNMAKSGMDKNAFHRWLPQATFPKVVLRRMHGRFYDATDCLIDSEAAVELLISAHDVIIKDALDTGEGRGVRRYNISSREEGRTALRERHSNNFIVQNVVRQHPALSQFNHSSVNVVRITTCRINNVIVPLAPTVRVGAPGSVTDVSYVNGKEVLKCVGLRDDGIFMPYSIDQDGVRNGIELSYCNLPKWSEMIEKVKAYHLGLPHFDIIGWDVTVTTDGLIVIIEYNPWRPGTYFYQYVHGPLFGLHTDNVLAFLRDKENRLKYIPEFARSEDA